LTGPAKVPGGYDFTVIVTDSAKPANTAMATLSITVAPMTITTTSLASTIVGKTYSAGLAVTGGKAPYKWAVAPGSALPPGITLSSSGRFAGAAKVPGGYDFTVTATDGSKPANVAPKVLSIAVAPMTITTTSLPTATVGKAYNVGLTVSGGKAAYKWAVAPGTTLPPGITLSSAGRLIGPAKVPGGYDVAIIVTDASKPANVAMKTLTLVVS
jgi:drug/metabolite transporter superfamily protein YnfA